MSNFEHAKYDADGVRIDDPTFNTQALRNDTSLVNGITFPAANTVAINTNSVERLRVGNEGQTTILAASSSPALKVTQTGAGNAFVVEDSASTDSTPFVIDTNGNTVIGHTAAIPAYGFNNQLQILSTTNGYQLNAAFRADAFAPLMSIGHSRSASIGGHTILVSGDELGALAFLGSDGTAFIRGAQITSQVDGTPGTNDMPGRLVFSTTADGASNPTEALRIDSTQSIINNSVGSGTNAYGFRVTSAKTGGTNNYAFSGEIAAAANRYNFYAAGTADNYFAGSMGIGALPLSTAKVYISGAFSSTSASEFGCITQVTSTNTSGAFNKFGVYGQSLTGASFAGTGTVVGTGGLAQQNAASSGAGFNLVGVLGTAVSTSTGTITNATAFQSALSSSGGATINNGIAFHATPHTVGTNGFGFYSDIAAAANRWNFYAIGTAANYFAGDIQLGKTVTAGGVVGAQTINKTVGTVNFAAAATSLVVTNSLVTANSIITATVGTNDATMKSVAVVAAAGSFTLHANAAATAETRVNFCVFN